MSMTNKYHTECAISIDSVVTRILADFRYSEISFVVRLFLTLINSLLKKGSGKSREGI